jgi:sugar/nucleoside kinase (ribokinase family)
LLANSSNALETAIKPARYFNDNVFGKARGRKPYCSNDTTDSAAPKNYLGFYCCERMDGMPTFDVLVIGRSCVDFLAVVKKFPSEDTKAPLITQIIEAGGQGSTASCCIAKMGGFAAYIGSVGDDENGRFCLQRLQDFGVETRWVNVIKSASTPVAYAWVSQATRSRTIIYEPSRLPPVTFAEIPEQLLTHAKVILVDPQATHLMGELKASLKRNIPIVYDCERWLTGMEKAMQAADYFIPSRVFLNSSELGLNGRDLNSQILELKKRIKGELIVTHGDKGAFYCNNRQRIRHIPAPVVAVKDTTGAGDNFHAAFALAIIRGHEILAAVKFSVAVASLSCREYGGRRGIPSFAEAQQVAAKLAHIPID